MDVIAYYRSLLKKSEGILESVNIDEEQRSLLTAAHNYLLDFDSLKIAISERPEVAVFDAAVREYQFALYALVSGHYRHAFSGLRLFFELILASIQFSAHEIDYRMWATDSKDINWSALKSPDSGIFSANFIRAFNPDFCSFSKQYLAIAEIVYRECSEFVHGNASTHLVLPFDIAFQKEIFNMWHQKAATMRLVVIFCYSARYLNYISNETKDGLEHVIVESLGNLAPVQAIFTKK